MGFFSGHPPGRGRHLGVHLDAEAGSLGQIEHSIPGKGRFLGFGEEPDLQRSEGIVLHEEPTHIVPGTDVRRSLKTPSWSSATARWGLWAAVREVCRWRRIDAPHLIAHVLDGMKFVNGIEVTSFKKGAAA